MRFQTLLLAILSSALIGCNSQPKTATNQSTNAETLDGYYRLGGFFVEGLRYHCGEHSGFLSTNGKFQFQHNTHCGIYLDRALIKEFNTTNLPDDVLLIENSVHTAQLLYSIDQDGNISNGVQITNAIYQTLFKAKLERLPLNDNEIQRVLDALRVSDYQGSFISYHDAKTLLQQSTFEKYAHRLGNVVIDNGEFKSLHQIDLSSYTIERMHTDYLQFINSDTQTLYLFHDETQALSFLEESNQSRFENNHLPLFILPSREPIDGVDLDVDFETPSDFELPDEIELDELS
jgi:hypothetical protein